MISRDGLGDIVDWLNNVANQQMNYVPNGHPTVTTSPRLMRLLGSAMLAYWHDNRLARLPSGEQTRQDFTILARLEVRGLDPCEALLPAGGDRLLHRSAIGPTVRQYHDA